MADPAALIVKAIEAAAFDVLMAQERYDLLDAIRTGGYQLVEGEGNLLTFEVAGETVLRVHVGPDGSLERLN